MALTGLYSINGETSALEDKGLRDFISTASGSWGGGGSFPESADNACKEVTAHSGNWNAAYSTVNGNSGSWFNVVTSTGGSTTYVNQINGLNISASTAAYASNGTSLANIYNSARSGYAASAYLNSNVTANVGSWNNSRNFVTANSGSLLYEVASYDSYNNPNFWNAAGNNVYGLKLNSGNFSQLTVSQARIDAWRVTGGRAMLDLYFWFSKFIPKTATSQYVAVQSNFFSFSNAHIAAPVFSRVENEWGTTFGCIKANTTWGTDIALNVWAPWTGYTGQEMVVTAHINIGL